MFKKKKLIKLSVEAEHLAILINMGCEVSRTKNAYSFNFKLPKKWDYDYPYIKDAKGRIRVVVDSQLIVKKVVCRYRIEVDHASVIDRSASHTNEIDNTEKLLHISTPVVGVIIDNSIVKNVEREWRTDNGIRLGGVIRTLSSFPMKKKIWASEKRYTEEFTKVRNHAFIKAREDVKEYMALNYPEWENPLAYWD